ncbi:MAG: DUF167 domain-containing protein [Chloroflexota bacterium]
MSRPDRAALLLVRVMPRAGRDAIDGVVDGTLRIRVAASPVDGAANTAVERLIADALGVARSSVRIAKGAAARHKAIAVEGLTREALVRRWPDLGV